MIEATGKAIYSSTLQGCILYPNAPEIVGLVVESSEIVVEITKPESVSIEELEDRRGEEIYIEGHMVGGTLHVKKIWSNIENYKPGGQKDSYVDAFKILEVRPFSLSVS